MYMAMCLEILRKNPSDFIKYYGSCICPGIPGLHQHSGPRRNDNQKSSVFIQPLFKLGFKNK
jgi:hypothetical protein